MVLVHSLSQVLTNHPLVAWFCEDEAPSAGWIQAKVWSSQVWSSQVWLGRKKLDVNWEEVTGISDTEKWGRSPTVGKGSM